MKNSQKDPTRIYLNKVAVFNVEKKSVSEIIVGLFQKFRLLLTRTKSMKQPLFKQDYIFSMIPLIGF